MTFRNKIGFLLKIFKRKPRHKQHTSNQSDNKNVDIQLPLNEQFKDILKIANILRENDELKKQVLDLKTQILDMKEKENQIIIQYDDDIITYKEEIQALTKINNDLDEQLHNTVKEAGDIEENKTRMAVNSILQLRPKLRTKTIAKFLGVCERTIRKYRAEFRNAENSK